MCMHVCVWVCTYVCAALQRYQCDNMREKAAGKRTEKEILLFCTESAEVVSSSDYYA